jgi:hypothetical protein
LFKFDACCLPNAILMASLIGVVAVLFIQLGVPMSKSKVRFFVQLSFFLSAGLGSLVVGPVSQASVSSEHDATASQISSALMRQIRLDLVAESVNIGAGTTRFVRTSENVILDALSGTLVDLGGATPTKSQLDSFRISLKVKLESELGSEWVLAVVRGTGLGDEMSDLRPGSRAMYDIYLNSVIVMLGRNDINTINLTLTGDSVSNGIQVGFVYYP